MSFRKERITQKAEAYYGNATITVFLVYIVTNIFTFRNMDAQVKKDGRGRPKKLTAMVTFNFRLEQDLYEWVKATKGEISINQYINDIIRKEKGL